MARRSRRGSGIEVNPARVREAREAAGLSLAQLARGDVSRTFIHFVEQGRSRPSQEVLDMIAERTGKPVSWFLAGVRPSPEPVQDVATQLTALAGRLRRVMAGTDLTRTEREAVKLLEVTLRQGAALGRAIDARRTAEAPGRR